MVLRLRDVIAIYRNIEERYRLRQKVGTQITDLIKLLALIVTVAHYMSCALNVVANIEIDNGVENTWLREN